eukprot:CAMPEP_0185169200 /NCGR_PEP_ID=MMETSP1139-20130426/16960_1 /TAXON_ID=298111 /ORGANISM="Pavlova sp., Strain CCMP459" /LENGTH=289 /DNA_ID=CAMNT_0027734725 /DNA_START=60 /DNA_END=926 /DNA_ORIENTATION=-
MDLRTDLALGTTSQAVREAIIPVDVQVVRGGLRRIPSIIDFGTISRANEYVRVPLYVVNEGVVPIQVIDGFAKPAPAADGGQGPDMFTHVERGTVLPPGQTVHIGDAWLGGTVEGHFRSAMRLRTNATGAGASRTPWPWQARVAHGGLEPANGFEDLVFDTPAAYAARPEGTVRTLELVNRFALPVTILGVRLELLNSGARAVGTALRSKAGAAASREAEDDGPVSADPRLRSTMSVHTPGSAEAPPDAPPPPVAQLRAFTVEWFAQGETLEPGERRALLRVRYHPSSQ